MARFERGGLVAALDDALKEDEPLTMNLDFVSMHTLGTACDLTGVLVQHNRNTIPVSVEMFSLATMDPTGKTVVGNALTMLRSWRELQGPEGAAFRKLAGYWKALPDDPVVRALALGAIVRNALVDSGFVVYTPLTNNAHYNHFHFHLPATRALADELADPRTSAARREALIAPDLALARGN